MPFIENNSMIKKNIQLSFLLISFTTILTACSSSQPVKVVDDDYAKHPHKQLQGNLSDPIFAISSLSEHQRNWQGTRYRLGGTSRQGIDCSGFMQVTFRELFGIHLPRMTVDQAKQGRQVAKSDLQVGDLVFFNTGRGPNGKHVGIYVKNGQFLHASTKGGVIYSNLSSPFWAKTFWQARRL